MCSREESNNQERSEQVLGTSPISTNGSGSEPEIHGLSHDLAVSNCATLIETCICSDKTDSEQIDSLRTAFITYLDSFQSAFRTEINKRFFQSEQQTQNHEQDLQEPWFTDYVTLKPLMNKHEELKSPSSSSGSSLKAKAQKIGKKACVLLSSNDNHEENNINAW